MGATLDTGIIDLDQRPPETAGDSRPPWHPRDWPRPVLITVTAVVAILATLLMVRATGTERSAVSAEAIRPASNPWALLYGSAILKLDESGRPVFDGINAVDSGFRLESQLEAGDYRLRFACASEIIGVDVDVLVRGGSGDMVTTKVDCDLDHTDAVFRVEEPLAVSVWVGSHQQASTAYAFAVVAE
ncbi:hypothetical protein [Phytomonospora endophytica]|uniref:Uncharacterized protein n=1 Tax=Phytomonospora endophytica TaxID=714109 RepID=A0A841FVE7_9ACTN|nr:hypothetical protein [Phytomonospora endophytica]MBB6037502.1 hypothetical protein [Phytomonospora endophytica]GIG70753.1 hypothetical protein Pen01_70480 [Phytomonospora endophytica]